MSFSTRNEVAGLPAKQRCRRCRAAAWARALIGRQPSGGTESKRLEHFSRSGKSSVDSEGWERSAAADRQAKPACLLLDRLRHAGKESNSRQLASDGSPEAASGDPPLSDCSTELHRAPCSPPPGPLSQASRASGQTRYVGVRVRRFSTHETLPNRCWTLTSQVPRMAFRRFCCR